RRRVVPACTCDPHYSMTRGTYDTPSRPGGVAGVHGAGAVTLRMPHAKHEGARSIRLRPRSMTVALEQEGAIMGLLNPPRRPRTRRVLGNRHQRDHMVSVPRRLDGGTTMNDQRPLFWHHRQGWFSEGTVPGARFGTIEHAFRVDAVVFEGRSQHQEV